MTEITVRALGDEDWSVYRDIRLAALKDSPEAFAATLEREQQYDEEMWHRRMNRSRRMVAEQDGRPVGVASVKSLTIDERPVGELFGLWVAPELRGKGVAWKLVDAGVRQARQDGQAYITYWVGTDNARGVAFASSYGFRPTDARRPMAEQDAEDGDDNTEMAMVYPLGDAVGEVPTSELV